MAVVTTNLGKVTAYAYAREKGYTGTEAEFAQLMADYADIAELTQNLPDIVAEEFSTSSTYAVGDYCLHDGKLYVCTSAVTTAGAWNSNKWSEISIADALNACVTATDENDDGNIVLTIGTT